MSQKFEAVTFDYCDINEWKAYFEEIKEVAESCKVIVEFWNELKRKCNGLTFRDLQEEFDYSTVLLGGVDSSGEYKERSLAKAYNVLFGFKPENIYDLVERLKNDLPPTTKIVVEETRFISFVKDVLNKVTSILSLAESKGLIGSDVGVAVDYYSILSDYSKMVEMLSDFVNNVARILPNYNQKSLFVWTLDKLTYRYMTAAYPNLKDAFEVVKDILGLEVIFSPDIENDGVRKEYEVYSFYGGSIGRELIELYKMIWEAFNGSIDTIKADLSIVFPEIPNFKKEFYEMSSQILMNMNWRFPENVTVAGKDLKYSGTRGNTFKAEYRISGIMLVSCYIDYCSTSGNFGSYETQCNIPLLKLLDDLAPGVFLLNNLLFDIELSKTTLEVRTPNVRAIDAWKYGYFEYKDWKWGIINE
jgi:hypothetical protein